MVDPVALKNFFDKAQRLRPNQSTTLPNNLDLTSTDTNALLAFTANEEELTQIRERITEAENKLKQLESSSIDKQLKEEHKKVKIQFFIFQKKKQRFFVISFSLKLNLKKNMKHYFH
jgi:hypothetical protein